jgi:hypothetical protein
MPNLYRSYAAECLKHATRVADLEMRSSFRKMAIAWIDLADQAEKNRRNDIVHGSPCRQRR